MNYAIEGKVAEIESEYVLILNRGSKHGVETGMIFAIKENGGVVVTDPDSGEEIGRRYPEKLRVKVFEVDERFSRATTYRRVSSFGNSSLLSAFGGRERIKAASANTEVVVTISVGDIAIELPNVSDDD